MIKFSIIMPVRGINDFVKESIARIKKLDYRDFEVFIVTDEKEEYDFGGTRIKLVVSGNVGPGEKRNLAAKQSTGDVLAFLDDDSYPEVDWLKNAARIFEDSEVYALGGPALTPRGSKYLEKMSGRVLESPLVSGGTTYRYIPKKKKLVYDYPSVNLFVRKKDFDKIGGFPIQFWPGEDTKLCLDLVIKYGRGFPYDPSVVVYHHRRDLFKPHLKQISRYGQHRGQFARIFPETSRIPMYFVPSLFVLGLISGIVLSFFIPGFFVTYLLFITIYVVMVSLESIRVSYKEDRTLKTFYNIFWAVFTTHVYYGVNFLIGLFKRPKLKLKRFNKETGNYVEG
jgi:glycosyltransferase involved in cell wall biosynthesis